MADKTDAPPGFAHLKHLSRVRSMAGIEPLTPVVHPGNHCPMHTALSLAAHTDGVSTLVIGTPECAYYSRNVPSAPNGSGAGRAGAPALHWTYVLDAQDVVFGCHDGVTQAIREMDESGAQAILLISTCVPEVNGEDVAGLCAELQPRVKARLMHVELGNYTCGGYEPGNRKTLLAFRALVEQADASDGTMNVMGRESGDDHTPLPDLLGYLAEQGVRLRFIGRSSDMQTYAQAGRACANLVVSPFFDELADWMERERGVAQLRLHSMYEADEILDAYRRIGEADGLDPAGAFASSYEQTRAAQRRLSRRLAERAEPMTYVSGKVGAVQPLPLNCYLVSLGMAPLMVHLEDFHSGDLMWKRRLLDAGADPLVCNMLNVAADRPASELLGPEFVLDDHAGATPTVRISDLYGRMGFERTLVLLERLESAMRNGDGHGAL